MPLKEFSADWAPAISAAAACLSLISILLLWHQIRKTNDWNRVGAAFQLLDIERFYSLEEQATKECKAIQIPFPSPLSREQVQTIRSNYNAYHAVKNLAIYLDRLSVAFQAGYVDKDVICATYGPILIGYKEVLGEYIEYTRHELESPEAYRDFSRTADHAKRWIDKRRFDISVQPDRDAAGGVPTKI